MELSSQQKKAVQHIGTPALVVAGAGSGKTRTLTAKINWLIAQGYEPERILAITFTNKAAEEMKQRLYASTGLGWDRFPWVRTYHSACFRILRDHCQLLGYSKPIQIYNTYQQQKTIKEILLASNYDKKYVPAVISNISMAKNSGSPEKYFSLKKQVANIKLEEVYKVYEQELKEKNAVDFDNILFMTRNLLRDHKEVKNRYRKYFQYILVDEYQDSNDIQEELTQLFLGHSNLFCVGDDWQAVYGFRGSNVNHFLSFEEKYQNAKIFRLEENYRSADEIVQVANNLINYNSQRMDKTCFSKKNGGIVEVYDDFFDEKEEASWVARKIINLQKSGVSFENIAIIYRTKFCSLAFEKAFRSYGIPYQMLGARGFFERMEILDLNSYLTASVFPKDDVSFERIINTPKRGIGPAMLKKISQMRTNGMSLQDGARKIMAERVLTPKIHNQIKDLLNLLDRIKDLTPDKAIHEIIETCNYFDHLKKISKTDKMDFISRKENIDELIYTASQKTSILEYLEEAALIREDKNDDNEEEEKTQIGVKLSTVHASKGLEYYAVFICACEENLFPHWKVIDVPMGLQEERRLMYVAVTRAERYLYITSAEFRRGQPSYRSRFIKEIEESM